MSTPVYPAVHDLFQALIWVEINTGMVIDSLERSITWHAIDQLPKGFAYDADLHDDPNSPALAEYIDPLGRLDPIVRIYSGMCRHFVDSREEMEKSIERATAAVQAAQHLIDNLQLPVQARESAQIIYALGQLNSVLASRITHGDDPRQNSLVILETLTKQCRPISEWIERLRGTAKLTRPLRTIEMSSIDVTDRATPIKMVGTAALHVFGVALEYLADAERDGTARGVDWKAEMQQLHDVLAPHRGRALEELQVIAKKGKDYARIVDQVWSAVCEPCLPHLNTNLHTGLLEKREAWKQMIDFILEPQMPVTTPPVITVLGGVEKASRTAKGTGPRMKLAEAEVATRAHLLKHPHDSANQIARAIGCSPSLVKETTPWRAVMSRRAEGRKKKTGPLTDYHLDNIAVIDPSIEALVKEQAADAAADRRKPSPRHRNRS